MPVTPLADAARAAFAVREIDEPQARTLGYGQRLESAEPGRTEPVAAIAPGRHPGGHARRVPSRRAQSRRVRPGGFVERSPCIVGPTPPGPPGAAAQRGDLRQLRRRPPRPPGRARALVEARPPPARRLWRSPSTPTRSRCCAPTRPSRSSCRARCATTCSPSPGLDGLLVLDFTPEFADQTPEDFVVPCSSRPRRALRRRGHGHPASAAATPATSAPCASWGAVRLRGRAPRGPRRGGALLLDPGPRATCAPARSPRPPHPRPPAPGHRHGRARRPPRPRLGYPTANLSPDPLAWCPPTGSMPAGSSASTSPRAPPTARCRPPSPSAPTRPSTAHDRRTVEAYVLDRTDLDLYGERVTVEFVAHLRPTLKFESSTPCWSRWPGRGAVSRDPVRDRPVLAGPAPATCPRPASRREPAGPARRRRALRRPPSGSRSSARARLVGHGAQPAGPRPSSSSSLSGRRLAWRAGDPPRRAAGAAAAPLVYAGSPSCCWRSSRRSGRPSTGRAPGSPCRAA